MWRTGANAATQFTTSAPITLAGVQLPAGHVHAVDRARARTTTELILNKQTGQWGTSYVPIGWISARGPMTAETVITPVEQFTISVVPN